MTHDSEDHSLTKVNDSSKNNSPVMVSEQCESQGVTVKPNASKRAPFIRYRVEYRDSTTDEVIRSHESEDPNIIPPRDTESPPFEVTKIFRLKPWRTKTTAKDKSTEDVPPVYPGAVAPIHRLRIFSTAIINALQSVVKYYPGQDLTGDTVEVQWPYPVLVHHYDEISMFAVECAEKEVDLLCERERDAASHIKLLLEYLDANVMETVRAEQERNRKGLYTFESFWVGNKPGTTILQAIEEDKDLRRLTIHSVKGGIFEYPPQDWQVQYWGLEFDGTYLGRVMRLMGATLKFDGVKKMSTDSFIRVGFGEKIDCGEEYHSLIEDLIRQGQVYWSLLKKQCKYYSGKTLAFPYNNVSGPSPLFPLYTLSS